MKFFQVTLEKIIVAKFIGIPLLLIDYFYRNFLTPSLSANIVILIATSYIVSCAIVHLYDKHFKKLYTTNKDRVNYGA